MLAIGLAAAIIAAICWAVSAALYKQGITAGGLSPITANLMRIFPALTILAIIGLILNIYPLTWYLTTTEMLLIIGSSLAAFVIGDVFYFVTLQYIGVSRGVPITNIYPLFVLFLQILFLNQPVHWLMLPAALSAILGVSLLGSTLESSAESHLHESLRLQWIGVLAAIATAASWSISIVMLSSVLQTTNLILVAVYRLIIALGVLTPLVVIRRSGREELKGDRHIWFLIGLGGLVALCFGYIAFAVALQLIDTTSATILSSLTPLFAAIIGWTSLKERISWRVVMGVIACIVGIILTTLTMAFI